MTVDPEFDFNPALPEVSNIHQATLVTECNPYIESYQAPWRLILSDGTVIHGTAGGSWPLSAGKDVPANSVISQLSTNGQGDVVKDNKASIARAVDAVNRKATGCASVEPALTALVALALLRSFLKSRQRGSSSS
jgi:hypothetical protein